MSAICSEIIRYWSGRAETYSLGNQQELRGDKTGEWLESLTGAFPYCTNKKKMKILDIGTGPGFFPILLASDGYLPDAADCTPEMLRRARENAGGYAEQIRFHQMYAGELHFPDGYFDAVINRNLTWNLEDPEEVYREWCRVLKPGGRLVIFDANWYRYLYDEDSLAGYEADRKRVAEEAIFDYNIGENFDRMERIARDLPLSPIDRPEWDEQALLRAGFRKVTIDRDVWKKVWTREEKINYASTPMFRIVAEK